MKKIFAIIGMIGVTLSIYSQSYATVYDDLVEYRTSVSQTNSDTVSSYISNPLYNTNLTPVNGVSAHTGATGDNFFAHKGASINLVNSTSQLGGASMYAGHGGTMIMLGRSSSTLTAFFLSPYAPIAILPSASYTTSNNAPSLVAFYQSPDNVTGGYVNFKITNSSNPSTQTTIYQSGASNRVTNGSYAFWKPYTLAAGTYYWHIQAQNLYGYKSQWVYGGQITIVASTPLYTVNSYTNPVAAFSTTITGTKGANVTITPALTNSGIVSVTYPTTTTFTLSFTGLVQGGNPFYFSAYDSGTKMSDSYTNVVVVDTLPPTYQKVQIVPSNTINGTKYITNEVATVNFSATDPSGVLYRYSLDGTTWTAWSALVQSQSIDFGATNGSKMIYAQYEDGVGNQ